MVCAALAAHMMLSFTSQLLNHFFFKKNKTKKKQEKKKQEGKKKATNTLNTFLILLLHVNNCCTRIRMLLDHQGEGRRVPGCGWRGDVHETLSLLTCVPRHESELENPWPKTLEHCLFGVFLVTIKHFSLMFC